MCLTLGGCVAAPAQPRLLAAAAALELGSSRMVPSGWHFLRSRFGARARPRAALPPKAAQRLARASREGRNTMRQSGSEPRPPGAPEKASSPEFAKNCATARLRTIPAAAELLSEHCFAENALRVMCLCLRAARLIWLSLDSCPAVAATSSTIMLAPFAVAIWRSGSPDGRDLTPTCAEPCPSQPARSEHNSTVRF